MNSDLVFYFLVDISLMCIYIYIYLSRVNSIATTSLPTNDYKSRFNGILHTYVCLRCAISFQVKGMAIAVVCQAWHGTTALEVAFR